MASTPDSPPPDDTPTLTGVGRDRVSYVSARSDVGWTPIPGPVDRTTFFEEQARHRRSTWRLSVAATVAVLVTGLPLSLVLTPVVHTLVLVVLTMVRPFAPQTEPVWTAYAWMFGLIFDTVERLDTAPMTYLLPRIVLAGVLMVIPGVAAMGTIWLWLGWLFARQGIGAVLAGLGAREPRLDDLEERQLVNVVEEMAIAAGLPAPRVTLIDSDVANAAAVGSSPSDATVVVSRRLLDELNRDDTQGALAHVIGSISNGDLCIALTVVRVFQTLGLASTLLAFPFSPRARATVWQLVGLARGESQPNAGALHAMLTRDLDDVDQEDVDRVLGPEEQRSRGIGSWPLRIRVYALFPLWFASSMAKVAMMMLTSFVAEPLVALAWRARRYLADATAVQLTRNPDGLAHALQALATSGGVLPGGRWAAHLFVVGGAVSESNRRLQLRWARMRVDHDASGGGVARRIALGRQLQREYVAAAEQSEPNSITGQATSILNFHPPLDKRLQRLRAQGASIDLRQNVVLAAAGAGDWVGKLVMIFVVGPLLAIATLLGLVALGMIMMLMALAIFVYMAVLYAVFF